MKLKAADESSINPLYPDKLPSKEVESKAQKPIGVGGIELKAGGSKGHQLDDKGDDRPGPHPSDKEAEYYNTQSNRYKGNENGKHKVTYSDGTIYEGDFLDGMKDGKGVQSMSNG